MNWLKFGLGLAQGLLVAVGLAAVLALSYSAISNKLQCWGAPADVEFHQGMTLCPGQSAHMHIEVPFRSSDGAQPL